MLVRPQVLTPKVFNGFPQNLVLGSH